MTKTKGAANRSDNHMALENSLPPLPTTQRGRGGVGGADGEADDTDGSTHTDDPPLVVSDVVPLSPGNRHRDGSQYLVSHAAEKPPAPASWQAQSSSSSDGVSGVHPSPAAGRRLDAIAGPLRFAGLGAKRHREADNTEFLDRLKRRATDEIWSGITTLEAEDLIAAVGRAEAEARSRITNRQRGMSNGRGNIGLPLHANSTRGTALEESADAESSGSEDELPSRMMASLSPPVQVGASAIQEINNGLIMSTSTTATPVAGMTDTANSSESLENLQMANEKRSYRHWIDENGRLVSSMGSLLPDKYQFHPDPAFPCICPVRCCRKLFRNLHCLGGHFSAKHGGTNLNDNGDGTFSIVGRYKAIVGRAPARVFSRNPLDPDEPPMPSPSLPATKPRELASERHALDLDLISIPASSASPAAAEATRSSRRLPVPSLSSIPVAEYLRAVFGTSYPVDEMLVTGKDIPALAQLPIRRPAPMDWVQRIANSKIQDPRTHPRPLVGLLMHMTGDSSEQHCDKCFGTDECVVANKRFPDALIERLAGCCSTCYFNCNVAHTKNECSMMVRLDEHKRPGKRAKAFSHTKEPTARGYLRRKPRSKLPRHETRWTTETNGVSRVLEDAGPGSGWSTEEETLPSATQSQFGRSAAATAAAGYEATAEDRRARQQKSRLVTIRIPRPQASRTSVSPLMLGGNVMSAGALEMEDWEVAPGRIPDEASEEPDNIAFSNAYLTLNQSIPVAAGVGFNVIVLKPGGISTWEAEGNKMRICSLATGKVGVKMDGGETFHLGINGMFKIKPGASCTVSNRQYIDAVLHVTSLDWE